MAIYSLQVKTVSRSHGRSVVAAAAYRAAQNIADDRLGVVWDFTAKRGMLHSEIMLPPGAPAWAADRAALWNAAERAEDKSTRWQTATVGRDIILALPHELTHEQRVAALRAFATGLVARYRVAVDFALHAPDRHGDERNYHAHLLLTTRQIGPNGFGRKTRELDGFRNGASEVEAIRQMWEAIGNRALEAAGLDLRIDCRSLADQGLDREATVHLGPVASGLERKGEATDLGDRNRAAKAGNAERDRLAAERDAASGEIIDLAAERARREAEAELRAAIRTQSPPRILDALTAQRATFSRTDLNRALAKVIFDPSDRATMTDRILALPSVVGLGESDAAPVSRYTTRRVLEDEARLLDDAAILASQQRHRLTPTETNSILHRHPLVTGERRAAFWRATDRQGLAVIAGEAGTAKSTTLSAIRDAYETAGYRVIGLSWTNTIVQNLQRDGFRATTIAAALNRLESGSTRWDSRTVLIVDEAAMVSTRHLAAVTQHARAAGAKLILAGDDRQLGSIERGGMFGSLRERYCTAELHEVVRVSDAAQRRAFNLMHANEYLPALAIFARQGAVNWCDRQEEALDRLVEKWMADSGAAPDKSRFVFAYTNADVAVLNAALRQARRDQGALGPDHMLTTSGGPVAFSQNDRIQFIATSPRRDERQAGIVNSAAGTICRIDGNRVTVALDGTPERLVTFVAGTDASVGEFGQFRHGYAGTIYKGQGRTIDQTYLYHTYHWRSSSGYVALSRHREEVSLFVATETARDLGQLARQLSRVDETRAASQFHVHDGPPEDPPTDDLAERRARVEMAIARRRQMAAGDASGPIEDGEDSELREARAAAADARARLQSARARPRGFDRSR